MGVPKVSQLVFFSLRLLEEQRQLKFVKSFVTTFLDALLSKIRSFNLARTTRTRLLYCIARALRQLYLPSPHLQSKLVHLYPSALPESFSRPVTDSLFSLDHRTSLTPASTPDKQYLFSSHPSAIFTLFVPVRHGKIQIYFLRAGGRSEDYGLGSVECWVGHNWEERRRFDGWWE
jgi:hypothetical protein